MYDDLRPELSDVGICQRQAWKVNARFFIIFVIKRKRSNDEHSKIEKNCVLSQPGIHEMSKFRRHMLK